MPSYRQKPANGAKPKRLMHKMPDGHMMPDKDMPMKPVAPKPRRAAKKGR